MHWYRSRSDPVDGSSGEVIIWRGAKFSVAAEMSGGFDGNEIVRDCCFCSCGGDGDFACLSAFSSDLRNLMTGNHALQMKTKKERKNRVRLERQSALKKKPKKKQTAPCVSPSSDADVHLDHQRSAERWRFRCYHRRSIAMMM